MWPASAVSRAGYDSCMDQRWDMEPICLTDNDGATYGGDLGNTRYRPFDQINASNFDQLEVAWRFKADIFGNHPEYKLEGTPLMVNGVLYATVGSEGNNERFASRVL